MASHVIFNKYINDANPLKLGYVEIWGVGSVPISSVSISVSSMVTTPNFTHNPATQVCDQRKVRMICPNPELHCAMPDCFPYKWRPLLQSPAWIPVFSVSQRQTAWWHREAGFTTLGGGGSGPPLAMHVPLSANSWRPCPCSLTCASEICFPKSLNCHILSAVIYHQLKTDPLFHVPQCKKKRIKKVWCNALLSLKILFRTYMKFYKTSLDIDFYHFYMLSDKYRGKCWVKGIRGRWWFCIKVI